MGSNKLIFKFPGPRNPSPESRSRTAAQLVLWFSLRSKSISPPFLTTAWAATSSARYSHSNFKLANTADPAKAGETVLIYCTGLGYVVAPLPADGVAARSERRR